MSQVKNLRAMFENKEETSPPERGRSSGVSTPYQSGPHGTGSPRPLSKVRTSFVAVEKDGRMGLRRDPSGESSVSRRRMSNDTDIESISTMPDKQSTAPSDEATRPARRLFVNEPIPESPRQPPQGNDVFVTIPASADATTADSNDSSTDKQPRPELNPAVSAQPPQTIPSSTAVNSKPDTEEVDSSLSAKLSKALATRPKATPRPDSLDVKSKATSEPAKSPRATKAPTTLQKPPSKPVTKTATKVSTKVEPKRDLPASSKPSGVGAAKPSTSAVAKKPQTLKPKAKSPTKPANLPSSLTAPTASSVSKGNTSRQSLSRQSGNVQNSAANARPTSRASVSNTGASAKTIRRQASTISRPRPSVGPPPKKVATTEPPMKKSQSQVDEGFLARMMRPTQSSSSKVAEKAPVTPPRKSGPRQSTGAQSNTKHASSSKRGGAEVTPPPKRAGTDNEDSSGAPQPATKPTGTGSPTAEDSSALETYDSSQPNPVITDRQEEGEREARETDEVMVTAAAIDTPADVGSSAADANQVQPTFESDGPDSEPKATKVEAVVADATTTGLNHDSAESEEATAVDQISTASETVEEEQSTVGDSAIEAPQVVEAVTNFATGSLAAAPEARSEEHPESLSNTAV